MIEAVVFDVGNVLFDWNPRFLYERLIGDGQTLDAFLSQVATREWHFQQINSDFNELRRVKFI